MININVISENIGWKRYFKDPNTYFKKKLKKFNKKIKIFQKKKFVCTILLTDDKHIKKLNKKFRNKNKSTDVLSFPFYEKKEFIEKINTEHEVSLGDIIINLSKIKSRDLKKFQKEFNILWIHGLVHLLGYDHKSESDFLKMTKIEKEFLSHII